MDNSEIQEIARKIRESEKPVQTVLAIIENSIHSKKRLVALVKELIEWL